MSVFRDTLSAARRPAPSDSPTSIPADGLCPTGSSSLPHHPARINPRNVAQIFRAFCVPMFSMGKTWGLVPPARHASRPTSQISLALHCSRATGRGPRICRADRELTPRINAQLSSQGHQARPTESACNRHNCKTDTRIRPRACTPARRVHARRSPPPARASLNSASGNSLRVD